MPDFVPSSLLGQLGTAIGQRIKSAANRYPEGLVAKRHHAFYTAFLSTSPWDSFWAGAQSGTGATGTALAVETALNDASYVRVESGTTAAGRAQITSGGLAFRMLPGSFSRFKAGVAFPDGASNATQTYEAAIGFVNSTTATPGFGAYFRMNISGAFEAVCRNNVTETVMSLTAPSTGRACYEVVMDATLPTPAALFYIQGELVATITTNLPTSGFMYSSVHIRKTLGTLNRRLRAYFCALENIMP